MLKYSRLGKCGLCIKLQDRMNDSLLSRINRLQASKEFHQHIELTTAEKLTYHERVATSLRNPANYLSIIADGASPVCKCFIISFLSYNYYH